MKKPLLIIIAAVIGLVVISLWVYLMFFNNNITPDNIFSSFGEAGEEAQPPENTEPIATPDINLDRDPLRQLTTRPVAGFREVKTSASSTPELYYVETGTGHVYSINTETGEEKRLSGTTIVQAREAVISGDGKYVAISSINNTKKQTLTVGKFSEAGDGFTEEVFKEEVSDFYIGQSNEVLYTKPETKGLMGYSYNLENNQKTEIFTLPFYEAKIQWGNTSTSTHFVYPKSSFALSGFLYEINNGLLKRLPLSGLGFSALVGDKDILYTKIVKETPTTFIFDRESGLSIEVAFAAIIDKCTYSSSAISFFCSKDDSKKLPTETPDSWYKGKISFSDALWQFDKEHKDGGIWFDTKSTGREVDIIKLNITQDFKAAYFINKNDNSLWMYEFYE